MILVINNLWEKLNFKDLIILLLYWLVKLLIWFWIDIRKICFGVNFGGGGIMVFIELRVLCNVELEIFGYFEFIVEGKDFFWVIVFVNLDFVMMGIFWLGGEEIKIIRRIIVKMLTIVLVKNLLENFWVRDFGNKEWINFKICC